MYRNTLLRAARLAQELDYPDALARAALANHRGYFSVVERIDRDRIAVLEAALDVCGRADSSLRARLLVTLAAELTFTPERDRRHRLADEAIAMARRLGEPTTLARVLTLTGHATFDHRELPAMLVRTAEMKSVAEDLADPALAFWAALWASLAAVVAGDVEGADRGLEQLLDLAQRLGQPFLRYNATFIAADRSCIAGRLEEAETLSRQALSIATEASFPDALRISGSQLFWIRYEQGRVEELVELLEKAASRHEASPLTRAALALALAETGRLERAQALFDDLAAGRFASLPTNWTWVYGTALMAELCGRLGDVDAARQLHDLLMPCRGTIVSIFNVTAGPVNHYLGVLDATLGRHPEAESHFEAAAAMDERMGAPTWLARTHLEWARMLLARRGAGDAERARELLGQALATARELGLGAVERRAVALLTLPF